MLSRRRSFDAAVFFSISDSNIYHFCGMSAGANIGRRRAAATRAGDQRRARLGDGYTAHRLLAGSSAPAPRPAPPNSTVRPSDRPTDAQISELQMRRRPTGAEQDESQEFTPPRACISFRSLYTLARRRRR